MLYQEFIDLCGYDVSYEDYTSVIEPMYMVVPDSVSKKDFISMLNKKHFEVKNKSPQLIKVMSIKDNSGFWKTPNGCYYHLVNVEVVDINIKTGIITVKVIDDSYHLGYSYDITEDDNNIKVIA